jgi:hypothetical protein
VHGLVYQSDIESRNCANAKRLDEARQRVKMRTHAQRKALRDMKMAAAAGMPR